MHKAKPERVSWRPWVGLLGATLEHIVSNAVVIPFAIVIAGFVERSLTTKGLMPAFFKSLFLGPLMMPASANCCVNVSAVDNEELQRDAANELLEELEEQAEG
jgi:hypothetical protein